MKNQSGFISKRYIQPDYYVKSFNNWAATYIINDEEYLIQSLSDPYDIRNEQISQFEVLKQTKTGRNTVKDIVFTNIKDAIKIILSLKEKEKLNNMKKFIMAEANKNTYKLVLVDEEGNKTVLNGEFINFLDADQTAKQEANNYNAQYVCNS